MSEEETLGTMLILNKASLEPWMQAKKVELSNMLHAPGLFLLASLSVVSAVSVSEVRSDVRYDEPACDPEAYDPVHRCIVSGQKW